MTRVVLSLVVLGTLADTVHAHKRVFRSKVRAVVPQSITVQEQRIEVKNTRNNNENVVLNINRQQELVDQQNFFLVNPLYPQLAGVPYSAHAYCQPQSAVQYGAYMQPQHVQPNQQYMPQSSYAETLEQYQVRLAKYREFLEVWQLWKMTNAWKPGDPPLNTGQAQPQAAPLTAVQKTCLKCHSGPDPKGRLDLSDLSKVNCFMRLEAVRRVTSDDPTEMMPPPKVQPRPSPSDIGALVQELSAFDYSETGEESQPADAEVDEIPEEEVPGQPMNGQAEQEQ